MIEMKQTRDKVFVDTNVWVYFYSATEPKKQHAAASVLERNSHLVVSTQVLNELISVLNKKFKTSLADIEKIIEGIIASTTLHIVDAQTIREAINLLKNSKYSYFDSLIIASALQQGCSTLFSEDMHDTHLIDKTLCIQNPFV